MPDDWKEQLPEDVRVWDEVKNSETPEAFWKQMTDQRSHIGQSIRIPSSEAGKEDWAKFNEKLVTKVPTLIPKPNPEDAAAMAVLYDAMGRPKEGKDYEFPEIDSKGTPFDVKSMENFRQIAYDGGLTKRQFEGVVKAMANSAVDTSVKTVEGHNQDLLKLREEWGLTFEDNIKAVSALAKKTDAPADFQQALASNQIGTSTLKWLHTLATSIAAEGVNLDKGDGSRKGALTPAEAKGRINDIMNNRQHPYWEGGHPQHAESIKTMLSLQKMANPDASTDINDLRTGASGQQF